MSQEATEGREEFLDSPLCLSERLLSYKTNEYVLMQQ